MAQERTAAHESKELGESQYVVRFIFTYSRGWILVPERFYLLSHILQLYLLSLVVVVVVAVSCSSPSFKHQAVICNCIHWQIVRIYDFLNQMNSLHAELAETGSDVKSKFIHAWIFHSHRTDKLH